MLRTLEVISGSGLELQTTEELSWFSLSISINETHIDSVYANHVSGTSIFEQHLAYIARYGKLFWLLEVTQSKLQSSTDHLAQISRNNSAVILIHSCWDISSFLPHLALMLRWKRVLHHLRQLFQSASRLFFFSPFETFRCHPGVSILKPKDS